MQKAMLIFMLLPAWCFAGELGKLIILNGCPASGKTTIAREIQKLFMQADTPSLWLVHSLDSLWAQSLPHLSPDEPQSYIHGTLIREGIFSSKDDMPSVALQIGPVGEKVLIGAFTAIEGFLKKGNNVIFEYVNYQPNMLRELVKEIPVEKYKVYVVGLKAPLSILENREAQRGPLYPQGHARAHYDTIHKGFLYDFTINTQENTIDMCARIIVAMVNHICDFSGGYELMTHIQSLH